MAMTPKKKRMAAAPDPYAALPPDVAKVMRASDKNQTLRKGREALDKGTVRGNRLNQGGANAPVKGGPGIITPGGVKRR